MQRKWTLAAPLFLLISGVLMQSGCARPERAPETRPEGQPPPEELAPRQATPAPSASEAPAQQPPPREDEVGEAVKRIFNDVVTMDKAHNPYFVAGDFNADRSEDLAVIVKPADTDMAVLAINDELANWLIREPKKIIVPKPLGQARAMEIRSKPDPIRKGDELLAIIHGFGPTGWRNPDARQTFLLKDVAGSGLRAESVKKLAKNKADLPLLNGQVLQNGDVLAETLGGGKGLLFWTGSAYSWYPQEGRKDGP